MTGCRLVHKACALNARGGGRTGNFMAIPELTQEQLEAARTAATEARRARAALKVKIKTGQVSLHEALHMASSDDTLSRVKVVDLLRSVPRVGVTRSAEIMENLDIAANRRIRGLGRHQVERLKAMFS